MDVDKVGRLQRNGGNGVEVSLKEESQISEIDFSKGEMQLPPEPIRLERPSKEEEELQKIRKKIRDLNASRDMEWNQYQKILGLKESGILTKEVDDFFNMALRSARQPDDRDAAWQRVVDLENSSFRFKTIRMLVYACALDYVNGDTGRFVALKEDFTEKSLGDLGKQLTRSHAKLRALDADIAFLSTLCKGFNEETMGLRGRELKEREFLVKKDHEDKIRMTKEKKERKNQRSARAVFEIDAEGEHKGLVMLEEEEGGGKEKKERFDEAIALEEQRKRQQRQYQLPLEQDLKQKEKQAIHDDLDRTDFDKMQPIIVTDKPLGESILLPPTKGDNGMERLKPSFKHQNPQIKRKDSEDEVKMIKERTFMQRVEEGSNKEMYDSPDSGHCETGSGKPFMHQAPTEIQVLASQHLPAQIQSVHRPKVPDLFSWDNHTVKSSSTAKIASQFFESWSHSLSPFCQANLSPASVEPAKNISSGTAPWTPMQPIYNKATHRSSKTTHTASRMTNGSRNPLSTKKLHHPVSSNGVKNHSTVSWSSGPANNRIGTGKSTPKVILTINDARITATKDPRSRPTDPRLR